LRQAAHDLWGEEPAGIVINHSLKITVGLCNATFPSPHLSPKVASLSQRPMPQADKLPNSLPNSIGITKLPLGRFWPSGVSKEFYMCERTLRPDRTLRTSRRLNFQRQWTTLSDNLAREGFTVRRLPEEP
jgi:hypothetical protein